MFSPLHPDLTFDRSAILRSAWAQARVDLAICTRAGVPTTLRQAFASALRSTWDVAKGIRSTRLWRLEQAAEASRRLTLAPIERETLDLRDAREIARHIDSHPVMVREVAAIDARLAQLSA